MHATRKAALLWSGGKDSALALHEARKGHPDIEIVKLATCVSQAYDRVSMHGVRRQLVEDQADALGLPLEFVVVPSHECRVPHAPPTPGTDFPPNDVYSRTILAALKRFDEQGIEVVVFGDIFLEDLRAYRDRLLGFAGLEGRYPLWGRDTGGLYDEFIAPGVRGGHGLRGHPAADRGPLRPAPHAGLPRLPAGGRGPLRRARRVPHVHVRRPAVPPPRRLHARRGPPARAVRLPGVVPRSVNRATPSPSPPSSPRPARCRPTAAPARR